MNNKNRLARLSRELYECTKELERLTRNESRNSRRINEDSTRTRGEFVSESSFFNEPLSWKIYSTIDEEYWIVDLYEDYNTHIDYHL